MTSNFSAKYWVSTEALITNIIIQNLLIAPKKIKKSLKQFSRFMPIAINGLVLIKSPMF